MCRSRQPLQSVSYYCEAVIVIPQTYPNLSLCGEEYDLYQIEVPDQSGLYVEALFEANQIDIDIAVALGSSLNDRGELVYNYESASPDQSIERVSISCLKPSGGAEQAWVAVYPYEPNMRGAYQLNLGVLQGGCNRQCVSDQYEGSEPAPLTDGLYNLSLCPGDEDAF